MTLRAPSTARLWALFMTGMCLALLAVGRDRMMRDPGTLWHTVVGEDILKTGHITDTDRFSFTHAGKPWLAQQWLGEVAMALVHRAAGLDGLLLAACAVLAATYASIAARLRRLGTPPFHAVFLTLIVIAASSHHFMPRPHLATIAFTALTFAILVDVEARRARPRCLWVLPVLIAVWSNIHGGALGGVAMIGIATVGWISRMLYERRASPTSPGFLITILLLSAAATLVNPFGWRLPALWIGLMSMKSLPKIMVEHAPLQPASPEGLMILALGVAYAVACWRARRAGLRVTWAIPIVWFILGLSRIRHGPLFAITAAIALADILPLAGFLKSAMLGSEPTADETGARGSPVQGGMAAAVGGPARRPSSLRLSPWQTVPVVVIGASLALQSMRIQAPLIGAGWARLSPANWPVNATEALRDELNRPGSNGRVFNELNYGGYLIQELPNARIYIDDRCELYGEAGLKNYLDLRRDPERFDEVAIEHDIRAALIRSRSRLAQHLDKSPQWTRRHQDDLAAVYVRSTVTVAQ